MVLIGLHGGRNKCMWISGLSMVLGNYEKGFYNPIH